MKKLFDIREELENISEASEEEKKLQNLVRAGLFDRRKLSILKRAMDKENNKLSQIERNALLSLLDTLLDQVLQNQQVYTKVKQNLRSNTSKLDEEVSTKNVPNVLLFKRKSIRKFPDGFVALYYSPALDRYISIPFLDKTDISDLTENNILKIKLIAESDISDTLELENGDQVNINGSMAEKIMSVYESMNNTNKIKMQKMINESKDSFNKVVAFTIRQ